TGRVRSRQSVQHRENWRRSDSRTEEYQRPVVSLQNKASTRRTYVESIADAHMVAQLRSARAVRVNLHADPKALRRDRTRERVAAKKRSSGGRLQAQNHKLAGQGRRKWLAVRVPHRQRQDVRGLVIDRRYRQPSKSWRGRMCRCFGQETRVSI